MRAFEIITEKKKRRSKGAAYGPGPFGMYGTAVGYSGDGGIGEDSNKNYEKLELPDYKVTLWAENTPEGVIVWGEDIEMGYRNDRWMDFTYNLTTDKVISANYKDDAEDEYPIVIDDLIHELRRIYGDTWEEIQDELHGGFEVEEGWKDVAAAGALGTALALGGGNAKAQTYNEPQQQVQTVQVPTWQEQLKAAIKDGDIPNGEKIQIQRDGGWITKVVVDGKIYDIEHRIPKLGKNLRNAASQLRKAMGNENVEEDWRHWVAGLGAASALAGGGSAAYDAYKASQAEKEPAAVVAKSNFKKGAERLAKDAVPKKSITGSPNEKLITQAAIDSGITGEELAQFLAQMAQETGNFQFMKELGNSKNFDQYEPVFKKDKKKKYILDPKTKKPKNFNPKAAGLGNDMPGDGQKYKGRGFVQLTGKYNYRKAGEFIGVDLVKNPDLVATDPKINAKVTVWYWKNRVQPKVKDYSDTKSATKPINPGLKHLDQRKEKFQLFKTAMK